MSYATIQPPFTLKLREMSRRELKGYFAWFQRIMPQRLGELARAVEQTPAFEAWRADYTPASLDLLGEWFAIQVEVRRRTTAEMQEIRDSLHFPIEFSDGELTNRTFSLAMDTAMYLSQVLLKCHPALRWDQELGGKSNVDYGQPILVGFGSVPLNPVGLLVTLAYGVANKTRSGNRLRELYEIWAGMIPV